MLSFRPHPSRNQLTSMIAGVHSRDAGQIDDTTTYTYDARGNLTNASRSGASDSQVESYTYNLLGTMSSYNKNGTTTSYTYDSAGLRTSKTSGDATTRYYLSGGMVVNEGTVTESGVTLSATNYIGNEIFGRKNASDTVTSFLLSNAHGDIEAVMQGSTRVGTYQYDAYGNITVVSEADGFTNPIRYAGEYFDEESGNYYLRARYYNPSLGRFMAEDPIMDGQNWYAYCYSNPIRYIDSTGKLPVDTIIDFLSIGWSFTDMVNNPSLANFGYLAWDVAAALIPYAPGSYSLKTVKAGTKIISKTDDYAKTGVWAMKAFDRGYEIERALGGMANNFPTIDKYILGQHRGTVKWLSSITSIKSIDITSSSYQTASNLKNVLKGYINDLIKFTGASYAGYNYQVESGAKKILEIAIPPVGMTSDQARVFDEITAYAKQNGVQIIIRIVE